MMYPRHAYVFQMNRQEPPVRGIWTHVYSLLSTASLLNSFSFCENECSFWLSFSALLHVLYCSVLFCTVPLIVHLLFTCCSLIVHSLFHLLFTYWTVVEGDSGGMHSLLPLSPVLECMCREYAYQSSLGGIFDKLVPLVILTSNLRGCLSVQMQIQDHR